MVEELTTIRKILVQKFDVEIELDKPKPEPKTLEEALTYKKSWF